MTSFNFKDLEQIGHVDVDAGAVWVGDPCYIIKDSDEDRPKDLGKNWRELCKTFFDRSGYTDRELAYSDWINEGKTAWFQTEESQAKMKEVAASNLSYSEKLDEVVRHQELGKEFAEKYRKTQAPFDGPVDKQFAEFNHDAGHKGMGIMASTYQGDGSYPVYVERGDGGRIRRIVIDFDPGCDE